MNEPAVVVGAVFQRRRPMETRVNPNSEMMNVRTASPAAGARRLRRFSVRVVSNLRTAQAEWTLKRAEARAPVVFGDSTSVVGLPAFMKFNKHTPEALPPVSQRPLPAAVVRGLFASVLVMRWLVSPVSAATVVNSFNDVADVALTAGSPLSLLDSAGGLGFTSGFEQAGTSVPVLKSNDLSVSLVNYVGTQTNTGAQWSLAATTASTGLARRAQTRSTPNLSGTIWFSFLASLQNANGDVGLLFNPTLNGSGVVSAGGGMRVGVGHPSRPGALGIGPDYGGVLDQGAGTGLDKITNGINGAITANGFIPVNGTAVLVLGKISDDPVTAYRKIDVWHNPDAASEAALPAPTLSFTNNAETALVPDSVNRLGFQVVRWTVSQQNEVMDNLKVSSDANGFDIVYKNVAPVLPPPVTNAIVNISGTYPHLAVFSDYGEVGIGAVVPWADKLWFITYPPHYPNGSADKLWTLDTNLTLTARPESVGGTDANRLIHRESQQLNIGHYLIDTNGTVRPIAPGLMPGRLTGSARHLTDPTNKIYIATMEEGFYELNVNTLAVTTLKADAQTQTSGAGLILPGNHGKGLYSGQGRLVYANNGDTSWSAGSDQISGFNNPAGLLVENFGPDFVNGWSQLERKNFTEVTGPGGIYGNPNISDPIWSVGWDKRSVILKLLDGGGWRSFRLPKGSYSHDSFQGWITEWPRIREITNSFLLMHMHGLFYSFPKTFSAANTAGLSPICTYLKMPVDYCWWNGQLVIGRDDTSSTGGNIWAGQSHSAPWFGQLSDLEKWGRPAGFGGVWKEDEVTNNVPSEPLLVKGFAQRVLHLKHTTAAPVNFTLQHDATGLGAWTTVTNLSLTNNGYAWYLLPTALDTTWVRLVADQNATGVTAYFHLQNSPQTPTPELFAGIADAASTNALSEGILRPKEADARTLQFAATLLASNGAAATAYYEMDGSLQLRRATNASAENTLRTTYSLASAGFTSDAASVIYTEGANRFRLPKNSAAYESVFASGWPRGVREVVTERNMFQAHGTFYELPKSGSTGSGGFRRIRPVTTHNKHISDFGSWRGLFAVAGLASNAATNTHVYRSDDGQAALWFGNVDDLWRLGAPRGVGGPWKNAAVTNGLASDPYLMFGYERKVLELAHSNASPVTFAVEVDFAADNTWSEYALITVPPGQTVKHVFPDGYSAHWVRLKSDTTTTATATFIYGPPAPQIRGASVPPFGNFQLVFTGSPGQPSTVFAGNDLATPLASWSPLTNGTFTANAATFQDGSTTNQPHRFYVVSIP